MCLLLVVHQSIAFCERFQVIPENHINWLGHCFWWVCWRAHPSDFIRFQLHRYPRVQILLPPSIGFRFSQPPGKVLIISWNVVNYGFSFAFVLIWLSIEFLLGIWISAIVLCPWHRSHRHERLAPQESKSDRNPIPRHPTIDFPIRLSVLFRADCLWWAGLLLANCKLCT